MPRAISGLAPLPAQLTRELERRLHGRRASGLWRELECRESAQQVHIDIDGRVYVNFTSNDYLGLAAHPRVCARVKEELAHTGFGSGAAALLSGRSSLHEELERAVAAATGFDSALLFSSGYLANLGAIAACVSRHDRVFHDRLNHASLIDAVKFSGARHRRYAHCDVDELTTFLRTETDNIKWVLTDAIFSMDGDIAPVAAIAAQCEVHDATLYVDDAHGFGVLHQGRGIAAELGPTARARTLLMVTCGKALGSAGAVVAAPGTVIEHLVQHARTFIYDTAPPPVCAAAALEALSLLQSDPGLHDDLARNIADFRQGVIAAGLPLGASATPIQPIMVGDATRAVVLAECLKRDGVYVRAIRPPTVPAGSARLRVSLSAAHTHADIMRLVGALSRCFAA